MALKLQKSFAPIRKQGKLPGEVVTVSYEKEYGKDVFALQKSVIKPGQRVVIVDDLLATVLFVIYYFICFLTFFFWKKGGTMKAACELVEKAGGVVVKCIVIIELKELCTSIQSKVETWSLFKYC